MTEFVSLRPKTYSHLMVVGNRDAHATKYAKKAKRTKQCVIKRVLKFNDHKDCLLNDKIILKPQRRSKNKAHNV